MADNISSLTSITTTATGLSNLILVSPQATIGYQPQNMFISESTVAQTISSPALLFNYEGEQSISLESDITDHFIEDNTAIQDQISLKPETISTHGFIGELNDVAPLNSRILQTLLQKLTVISAYTPALSVTALNAYNEAFQAYQVAANLVTSAVSTWATITRQGGENVIGNAGLLNPVTGAASSTFYNLTQTKQQLAFQQFWGYWQSRTLFTIQTPWAVFQNMAILRLRAIQDAETNTITDFEITFKRLRLASTLKTTAAGAQSVQGRLNPQSASLVQGGTSSVNQAPQFNLGNFSSQF